VGSACQRPGAKRSRKAFRALGERGLTGCDPRPYPRMARLRSPRSLLLNASGNTGQTPDVRRTNTGCRGRGVSGQDFASSRNPRRINTFTRRAPESAPAEPISSRCPVTRLFSMSI
jgi:hypothetical protein